MSRFIDPLYFNSLIDSNIMDDVADGQDEAVNEIIRLMQDCVVTVLMPYTVQDELKGAPAHVRKAANIFIFTEQVNLTAPEQALRRKLIEHARGDAQDQNIVRDLCHVAEAAKYGGYFITRDKRLLRRRGKIAEIAAIEIVTPTEFLDRVRQGQARAQSQQKPN